MVWTLSSIRQLLHGRVRLIIIGVFIALTACAPPQPTPPITPRATITRMSPATATPLPTPTPTLTPTPTAMPLEVVDELRARRATTPVPQRGAPCGVVDILDFPVGPPDGRDYLAPWPFGTTIDRYAGLHAGEDWIYASGGSLGKPVYSIGHGMVTYAQPLGWGIDLGVVIVRHVFPDGRQILSFYGHLEPDSVILKSGDCVKRGDPIGRIGNPRGRPHLHFEIRHQLPDQPGPGYWPVDPRLAGWEPPTEYIWDERMGASPGVKWTRPFTSPNSIALGLLISDTLAVVENQHLTAVNVDDGRVRWSEPLSGTLSGAIVDETGGAIYLTTLTGTVQSVGAQGQLLWQIDPGLAAQPTLLPLPGGGVIVHAGQQLFGISSAGVRVWQIGGVPALIDWAIDSERLLFTTGGDQPALYSLDRTGSLIQLALISGRLALSRGHIFVYSPTGIYQVNGSPTLLKPIDRGVGDEGSIVTAYDGSVIVAHDGTDDRRLIALNPDGSLRWERSVRQLSRDAPRLIASGRRVYAVTHEGDVFSVDPQSGAAQRIFNGYDFTYLPGQSQLFVTRQGRLMFDYRGGRIVALDPQAALVSNAPEK